MKHTLLLLSSALLCCMIFARCDSDSSDDDLVLIPTDTGNHWDGIDARGDTFTLRVEGTETINGVVYSVIRVQANEPIDEHIQDEVSLYVRETEGGLYIGEAQGSSASNRRLLGFLLRYPIEDNASYSHIDEEGNEFTVQVSKLSATVPAGTFDVIQYRTSDGGSNNWNVLIAPGIGPVVVNDLQLTGYDVQ